MALAQVGEVASSSIMVIGSVHLLFRDAMLSWGPLPGNK